MRNYIWIFFISLLVSCEKTSDFDPYSINDDFIIKIENDESPADGITKIKIVVELPSEFDTETDNIVDFSVFKETIETGTSSIILTEIDEENKKIAEYFVSHNKADSLMVKATIQINESTLSKDTYIHFKKAYLDSINVLSSSLLVSPNSFNEVELTTELHRNTGIVTLNSLADTFAKDTLGNSIGIFNNYDNLTNSDGEILNKFTLGNDDYTGRLFIISNSINEINEVKSDTITIYSQN